MSHLPVCIFIDSSHYQRVHYVYVHLRLSAVFVPMIEEKSP